MSIQIVTMKSRVRIRVRFFSSFFSLFLRVCVFMCVCVYALKCDGELVRQRNKRLWYRRINVISANAMPPVSSYVEGLFLYMPPTPPIMQFPG
ncbi:hypothetical protein F5X96DRAFT_651129 [Biscogniauxia mediterranea]|nr:hypothetical protein F5X96DRAFT_651129 [Biscogniauxia mediterranea]